jgi:hypothetical protein
LIPAGAAESLAAVILISSSSSSASSSSPSTTMDSAEPDLVWSTHPARERVGGTIALVAFLVAIFALVWFSLRDPGILALAIVILCGALAPWFLPSRYRIDERGIEETRAGVSRRRAWSDVRSVYVDAHGVTLSPFARRSWLEPHRAIRVLFASNGDRVVAALERRMSERCANGEVRWIATPATRPPKMNARRAS